MNQAIIMMGVPGSMKSTYAKRLCEALAPGETGIVCSADDYRMVSGEYVFSPSGNTAVHSQCLRRFIRAMQDGDDLVICDNTNTTLLEIAPYFAVAQAFMYDVSVHYMGKPGGLMACVGRNVHGVPEDQIQRMDGNIYSTLSNWPKRWGHIVRVPDSALVVA